MAISPVIKIGTALLAVACVAGAAGYLIGQRPATVSGPDAAAELKALIASITPDLIREPHPDEVRREELTSLPDLNYGATSLTHEQIMEMIRRDKESLIENYIAKDLDPKVTAFRTKWTAKLDSLPLDKKAWVAELDKDAGSLEMIDRRFQTPTLKARVTRIRELIDKLRLDSRAP